MQNKMDRVESLIFNYGTTNRGDFRPIDPKELDKIYLKPTKNAIKASSVKDKQTFIDENAGQDKTSRYQFEQVRSAPERIVMAPTVNIDNITDAKVRQILIKDMYTSSTQRAYEYEAIWPDVKAPLPARYAKANPFALLKGCTPYVSPEWRAQSMEWDRKQLRAYCNANKEFWSISS